MRSYRNWQWHLDKVLMKIGGETHCLYLTIDREGEVLEFCVTNLRHSSNGVSIVQHRFRFLRSD
jgi:transposase-like protein